MLSRIRDVLTRHRKKILILGVVFGGSYVALKYVQNKLIEMQERHAREFMEKSRRMQHFETTENTCNQFIKAMGAELMQAILKECSTDELLKQLRENPTNKVQLWEEMKIMSFTRLTTFIYASSMLVVSLRIQLNLLGGYLYKDTMPIDAGKLLSQEQQPQINDNLKQRYLLLSRFFINEGGLSDLIRLIRSKVISVIKDIPLTERLSLSDIEQLFWSLQMSINSDPKSDPCSKIFKYLLPSQSSDYSTECGPLLQKMFNETMDLLESDDVSSVCTNNICRGFSLAIDAIAENMSETLFVSQKESNEGQSNKSIQTSYNDPMLNINSLKVPLAKIIPLISGLTSKGFDSTSRPQNLATSLITFYMISEKCKVLGANVYETFSSA